MDVLQRYVLFTFDTLGWLRSKPLGIKSTEWVRHIQTFKLSKEIYVHKIDNFKD